MTNNISGGGLMGAAKLGGIEVEHYLRGEPSKAADKEAQLARANEALQALRGEVALPQQERGNIIRGTKHFLVGVESEIRASADEKMKKLQDNVDKLRTATEDEERKDMPLPERVMKGGEEIVKEIKEGDWKTWLKYGALATGGAIAAKWIWDHTFGWLLGKVTGEDGVIHKTTSWIAAGLGAAAAALGFKWLMPSGAAVFDSLLPPDVRKAKDRAVKGWTRGGEYVAETLDPMIEDVKNGNATLFLKHGVWHLYKGGKFVVLNFIPAMNDLLHGRLFDFIDAHAEGMHIYGASIAPIMGTIKALRTGSLQAGITEAVWKTLTWELEAYRLAKGTAKGAWRVGGMMYSTYLATIGPDARLKWNTTLLRASSEEHLQALCERMRYLSNRAVAKSGNVAKATALRGAANQHLNRIRTVLLRMQGDVGPGITHPRIEELFGNEVAQQVKAAHEQGGILRWKGKDMIDLDETLRRSVHRADFGNAPSAATGDIAETLARGESAFDMARSGKKVKDILTASEELETAARLKVVEDLFKAGSSMDELLKGGAEVDELLRAGAKAEDVVKAAAKIGESMRISAFESLVGRMPVDDLLKHGASCADLLQAGADAKGVLAAGGTADDFVRAGMSVDDFVRAGGKAEVFEQALENAAKASGGVVRRIAGVLRLKGGETVEQILETAGEATGKAVRGSKRVMGALTSVVRAKTPEAVQRILRAASSARNIGVAKVGLGSLGMGLDVFGIVTAYMDWVDNGRRIDLANETGNTGLADLYSGAYVAHGIKGGVSAASLVISGFALKAAGVAGAATAGLVLLPVALAAAGGGYVRRELEAAAENWLKTEKDWARATPGELLRKLEDLGPGSTSIFVSAALSPTDFREGLLKASDADAGARYNIVRTYIVKTSQLEQSRDETPQEFQMRYDEYVRDQVLYMHHATQGKFDTWLPSVFEMARSHARLCAISRDLKKMGQSYAVEGIDLARYSDLAFKVPGDTARAREGEQKHAMLGTYVRAEKRESIDALKQSPQAAAALRQRLLGDIEDHVGRCEARILATDFDGLLWKEDRARRLARAYVSEHVRTMLGTESQQLAAKGSVLDVQDYEHAVSNLRAFLQKNPLEYQKEAESSGFASTPAAKSVLDHGNPEAASIERMTMQWYMAA